MINCQVRMTGQTYHAYTKNSSQKAYRRDQATKC